MPPTFLVFVAAVLYFPTLTALLVEAALVCLPNTRALGRRVIFAAVATVPGLAAAAIVVGVLAVIMLVAVVSVSTPFAVDGRLTNPAVIGVVVVTTFTAMAVMAVVTMGALAASARIGWAIGGGLGVWQVLEHDRLLNRVTPSWVKAHISARAAANNEADEARDG